MNYELVKRLAESGFPQKGKLHEGSYLHIAGEPDRLAVIEPTLSELIEACGSKFTSLTRYKTDKGIGWCAMYESERGIETCGDEATSEEAVAELWLSINKNRA